MDGAADPVLARPELAGLLVLAPHPLHEDAVGVADEAGGERERVEAADGVVHRLDVVVDLLPVVALLGGDVLAVEEGLLHPRLRPLDPAALRRLLHDVHADEELDVGDVLGVHVEPAELAVGLAQEVLDLHVVEHPRPVDGRGLEALVAALADVGTGVEVSHEAALLSGGVI